MDAQTAINTAYAANAVDFANVEATKVFRNELENTLKVPFIMSSSDEKKIRDMTPFPVLFTREKPCTDDHPVLKGFREIVRQTARQQSDPRKTSLKSLMVGSAAREYFSYVDNKNVYFQFAMKEAKDQVRVVEQILEETLKRIRKNATSSDKKLFYSDEDAVKDLRPNSRVVKFRNTKALLKKLTELDGNEVRVVFDDVVKESKKKFTHLYFEDVGYNFEDRDWCSIFENTGAVSGDGYMFLPLELIFPNMIKNEFYDFETKGAYSYVTYKFGQSNGYIHKTSAWSCILNNSVVSNGKTSLCFEITSRVGPMVSFKISKVFGCDTIVRKLSLPEKDRYIRILDLMKLSVSDGKDFSYVSVGVVEYENTVVYANSIAEKSLTLENLVTYVRRMRAGVSMANAEFLKPWSIENKDIFNFCCVVMVQTIHMRGSSAGMLKKGAETLSFISNWKSICEKIQYGLVCAITLGTNICFDKLVCWLNSLKVVEKLVVNENQEVLQISRTSAIDAPVHVDVMTHDSLSGVKDCVCPVCLSLQGRIGKQVFGCQYLEDSVHTFDVSSSDIKQFKMLIDQSIQDGPSGLSSFLKSVKQYLPNSGFKHTVRVENFHGGPGTGKSFIARKLWEPNTAIVGPFAKLAEDYVETLDDGTVKTYPYTTMHKALELKNKTTVFFDEWTSIDYVLMAIICRNVGAKTAVLFGDVNQTGVLPSEGRPPVYQFDFSKISTHRLLMNFRNTQYAVALLNSIYDYGMFANSEVFGLPEFVEINDESIDIGEATPMTYSYATASAMTTETNDGRYPTVRRFQGSTVDKTALFFTDSDHSLINNSALFCVAMSRDRNGMTFYTDAGDSLSLMRAKCRIDDHEFIAKIPEISHPSLPTKQISKHLGVEIEFGELGNDGVSDLFKPKTAVETVCDFIYSAVDTSVADEINEAMNVEIDGYLWCSYDAMCVAGLNSDVISGYKSYARKRRPVPGGIPFEVTRDYLQVKGVNLLAMCGTDVLHADNNPEICLMYSEGMSHVSSFNLDDLSIDYVFTSDCDCEQAGLTMSGSSLFSKVLVDNHIVVGGGRWIDYSGSIGLKHSNPAGSLAVVDQTVFKLGSQLAELKVEKYSGHNGFDKKLVCAVEDQTFPAGKGTTPGFNSYLQGDLVLPVVGDILPVKSVNEPWSNNGMYELARNGSISIDFFSPVNVRGNVKNLSTRGYVASPGYGLRFHTNNNYQSLQSLAHRYVRKRRRFRFCYGAKVLAREVAQLAVNELFDLEKLRSQFVDVDMSAVSNEFRRAAEARHYVEKFEGENFSSVKTVRYHLKDIFKPAKDGKLDPSKPGQGISAWSSSANLDFGAAMRCIGAKFRDSLKPNVLFNNGYTEEEFANLLNEQLSKLPISAKAGVVDGKEFDSMQNEFTQEIEKNILKAVGVSEEFIVDYYSYRKDYVLLATNQFVAHPDAEKTSGEPGTLLLNSVLEMVLANAILRGTGPFVMAVQGDDGLKNQTNLKVDENILNRISLYSDFKLKVEIGKDMEFCGDVVVGNLMYPCIYRTLQKIFGNCFKSLEHFQEYQISLRDKVSYIERLGVDAVMFANCKNYSVNYETMNCVYDMIKSFSHINEEQFFEVFYPVEFVHCGPSL